jgi:hypothetical protein
MKQKGDQDISDGSAIVSANGGNIHEDVIARMIRLRRRAPKAQGQNPTLKSVTEKLMRFQRALRAAQAAHGARQVSEGEV